MGEPYQHPGTTRRLAVLAEGAAEFGVTTSQVVLARLVADPRTIKPILGVGDLAQLDEALAAAAIRLAQAFRQPDQRPVSSAGSSRP